MVVNEKEIYETSFKMDNGRFIFVGWTSIDDKFVVERKETTKFIYVTYKYLNGNVEYYRYRK